MITLFSTPKPFRGHIDTIQRNALKSWKLLHADVQVILFGEDEGTVEVCHELGLRHVSEVVRSEHGTKRLDSIFGQVQKIARYEILSYVNCDIILTAEFIDALKRLLAWQSKFLMVGRRWDTDVNHALDFSRNDWQEKIIARAHNEGFQRFYHNIDYFVFPRGLYTEIPPLVVGRVWWDHWLVGKARACGAAVVDVSEVVCAIHQNHDYEYHAQGITGVLQDEEARRNYELAHRDTRLGTIEDATYRLTAAGIQPNRLYWLAPAKRRWRGVIRKVRGSLRTNVWHPLLHLTRPVRHAMGLRHKTVLSALRNSKRRHWMDQ